MHVPEPTAVESLSALASDRASFIKIWDRKKDIDVVRPKPLNETDEREDSQIVDLSRKSVVDLDDAAPT